MNIETLNNQVNDLAVLRLEIAAIEAEQKRIIEAHEQLQKLQADMEDKKAEKDKVQTALLETMKEAGTLSWKTEMCTVSRASRTSLTIDPALEKPLKTRLMNGEQIDGLILRQTEYISIRHNPKK